MTTPLTIAIDRRDGEAVAVVATGEIDLSNVGTFARALDDALSERAAEPLTVDLSAVDYLDSGGINVLFDYADRIRIIVRPLLVRVLTISGLTDLAPVETAPQKPEP